MSSRNMLLNSFVERRYQWYANKCHFHLLIRSDAYLSYYRVIAYYQYFFKEHSFLTRICKVFAVACTCLLAAVNTAVIVSEIFNPESFLIFVRKKLFLFQTWYTYICNIILSCEHDTGYNFRPRSDEILQKFWPISLTSNRLSKSKQSFLSHPLK